MNEKQIIKKNIKDNLPYGSLSQIVRTFKKNTGKDITVAQVANICNPAKSSWNSEIIEIAQGIVIAQKKEVSSALEKLV